MKGVSGLDEIGLERVEQPIPAARVQGQAVVEGARYFKSGERGNTAALGIRMFARHDDRMLPGGMRGEPGVFRADVAFHAAAGRRIKKGRVHQMHDWKP